MNVKLVSKTAIDSTYLAELMKSATEADAKFLSTIQEAEALMVYIARVSSPNQKAAEYSKLLKYCMNHGHWSVFEQVSATFEIETTRAISAQILRHKSFNFQEFSQRYQIVEDMSIEVYEARRQDSKNRQNSINDLSEADKDFFEDAQREVAELAFRRYNQAIAKGISKESARNILPLNTKTKMYVTGTLRSWIHYLQVRTAAGTQKEHRDIALAVKEVLKLHFPITIEAMDLTAEK